MALQRLDDRASSGDPFAIDERERALRYDRLLALLESWAVDDDAAETARRQTLAALDATRRDSGMHPLIDERG